MSTVKVTKDTLKTLTQLKGALMQKYGQSFTFDEILYAILEYMEDDTNHDISTALEIYLPISYNNTTAEESKKKPDN